MDIQSEYSEPTRLLLSGTFWHDPVGIILHQSLVQFDMQQCNNINFAL